MLPSYMGIVLSHIKSQSPYQPISTMECQQGFAPVSIGFSRLFFAYVLP